MKYQEPKTPFEAAVKLIEAYVLRGDDPQWIRKGQGGAHCHTWAAQIGGWRYRDEELTDGKKYGTDKIIVSRFNGQRCAQVFRFEDVYQFIKQRAEHPALF